ncbi:MAG TPA: vWA domain-containing protein [Tepidisphaeraceae bacterium]|nr:vWA domain-containing protein [Tepidisphaeraceae bacterium]
MSLPLIQLRSPTLLAIALLMVGIFTLLLWRRTLPRATKILAIIAAACLAIAAGQPTYDGSASAEDITVLVDLSASTRGATYRGPQALQRRLGQLLGDRPYQLQYFAGTTTTTPPPGDPLPDLPADRTIFTPPASGVAIVFSDGRFELPATAPPTYIVIDPALDRPVDARMSSVDVQMNQLRAAFANNGPPREIVWTGVSDSAPDRIAGDYTLQADLSPNADRAAVRLSTGDNWPENDAMATVRPPPTDLERWWVGRDDPGAPWRRFAPADLPTDATALLGVSVIVLQNVSIDELPLQRQLLLDRYVRRLGGTLILLGGDAAFTAGGYAGSALDALSPLASSPPQPTVEWTILTDASGSMAAPAGGGGTRFDAAVTAARTAVAALPPNDTVSVGSFARDVRWWSTGRSVTDTLPAIATAPPIAPNGPTNLAAALDAIVAAPSSKARQILLITDGGADPVNVAPRVEQLRNAASRLNVLSIGNGPASDSLAQIAVATGGTVVTEADPARWSRAAAQLLRAAIAGELRTSPARGGFSGELATAGDVEAAPWNPLWPRAGATVVATNTAGGEPLAAWWNAGTGRVIAFAYTPPTATVALATERLARPPRDERFAVRWDESKNGTRMLIDAVERGRPLNGAAVVLDITGESRPVPQVAPGRYELTIDPSPSAALATVLHDGQVIARRALPARYAPEFAAIGNDYAAMRALAERTGGAVVNPAVVTPLDLPRDANRVSLTPPLAMLGGFFVATALIAWRRGS